MKSKWWIFFIIGLMVLGSIGFGISSKYNIFDASKIGQALDSLNGVKVYYNGSIKNVNGRSVTADKYNLGVKYQCVEFVKRYYYYHLGHKMPDSYGNAKDFFDKSIKDGEKNKKRNLLQFCNPSISKPKVDDIIVFSGSNHNQFGHIAIISNVTENEIEIIQQNPGKTGKSRVKFPLIRHDNKWGVGFNRAMGWLRKE